jgi:hypothetical protein
MNSIPNTVCESIISVPTESVFLTAPVDRVVSSSTTKTRNERTATHVTRRRYYLEKTTRTGKVVNPRRRAISVVRRTARIVVIASARATVTGSGGPKRYETTEIRCGVVEKKSNITDPGSR